MLRIAFLYTFYSGILLSLISCVAYAPTSPTVPLVAAQGELEISGSAQLNGRLEGRGVYSPWKHVLLSAGGSTRPNFLSAKYFRVQQAEVALGGYAKLSGKLLISGMMGAGRARTDRRFEEIFGITNHYQARYHTVFGQVGVGKQFSNSSLGLGYRLTSVRFQELKDKSIALPLRGMIRHELLANMRYNLDSGRHWQAQASAGFSVGRHRRPHVDPATDFGVQYNQLPSMLVSLGVVWWPRQK